MLQTISRRILSSVSPKNFSHCLNVASCSTNVYDSASLQPLIGYEQGATSADGVREYFYYVDHHGQLFLDDARMKNFTSCFKDKEFLAFFFTRLRSNNTDRYNEYFPYVSLCGPERNFVRSDDRPIVYSNIQPISDEHKKSIKSRRSLKKEYIEIFGEKFVECQEVFEYNHAGNRLCVPFQPTQLCMLPSTGRVYYPTFARYGNVALVRSGLAIKLAKMFEFGESEYEPPTAINWQGKRYELNNRLFEQDFVSDKS